VWLRCHARDVGAAGLDRWIDMAENALVTDGGGSAGLPVELADAFTAIDGAWEQWAQQTNEVRQTYVGWVAEPQRSRTRRKRARWTADYASRGALLRSVQRWRDRKISREIFAAVLIWLAVVFVVGTGELLLDKVLNGRYAWLDLRYAALPTATLTFGSTAGRVWRHRRAPIGTTVDPV
jgi:hypothetical protein